MKVFATIGCLTLLALPACATSSSSGGPAQQSSPATAAETMTGTWNFVVTGKDKAQRFSFAFTDMPADTCISGNWFQVKPIQAPSGQVSRPAYQLSSGKLEVLLSTELCDAYTSFIGNVAGSTFVGSHVSYGMFGSTEHGKVTGSLRP